MLVYIIPVTTVKLRPMLLSWGMDADHSAAAKCRYEYRMLFVRWGLSVELIVTSSL